MKALAELDVHGHWALVGATGERAAGNGAAMRIAPLAFVLDPDIATQRQTLRDVCRITHRNDEAYIGALAIVRTVRQVLAGAPLDDDLLRTVVDTIPDSRVRDRLSEVHDSSLSASEYVSRFASSGYVVDSVPLANLAATRSSDALETIREIVQCGGDTDTVASMFGQIFGAAHGSQVLPLELIDRIDEAPLLRATAGAFARAVRCVR